MNLINEWAEKWGVSEQAIRELRHIAGVSDAEVSLQGVSAGTEKHVQGLVRLQTTALGAKVWRNNVGAMYDETGRLIRFGLGNDSAKVNKNFKSSDLIGITPYTVRPHDVGSKLGLFTAYEIKKSDWVYTGKGREPAQLAFIDFVLARGGLARFVTDPEQVYVEAQC